MEKRIRIRTGDVEVLAELNDSEVAGLIWDILPIQAEVSTWGDEIYFSIPVKANLENPKDVVEKGDLGYWPQGPAFCIFFGKTPISKGSEIRPASSVEVVGKVCDNPDEFKKVASGEKIILERIKE
ncbi:MAG: cyclophilin-like fold protein [bacterium]|nr:cyclophilin-like fold protein [bacterium]